MDLLEELENRQEYKAFMKTRKHRAILVSIILLIFWLCLIYANNPSTSRSQKFVLFMILALSTALDIRIIHSSFFTKPRILKGTIIDTKLVLNDSGHRYHVSERKNDTQNYIKYIHSKEMCGEKMPNHMLKILIM